VSKSKQFSFLGERSLSRSDTSRVDRKQLVGILTEDPSEVLSEGAQILNSNTNSNMLGHVTSSYFSPTLNRSIAMGLVRDGLRRKGEKIIVATAKGKRSPSTIESYVFFDPDGLKMNGNESENVDG